MRSSFKLRIFSLVTACVFLCLHTGIAPLAMSEIEKSVSHKMGDHCGFSCQCLPGNCHCQQVKTSSGKDVVLEMDECSPAKKAMSISLQCKDFVVPQQFGLLLFIVFEPAIVFHLSHFDFEGHISEPPLRPPISSAA